MWDGAGRVPAPRVVRVAVPGRPATGALVAVMLGCVVALSGCDDGATRAPSPNLTVGLPPYVPYAPYAPLVGPAAAPTTVGSAPSTGTAATGTGTVTVTEATATTATTPTTATVVPVGPCLPRYGEGRTVPVEVQAAGRTLTLSWRHNGDPATLSYLVGVRRRGWVAVGAATDTAATTASSSAGTSLTEYAVTWTAVAVPTGCRTVTFTVPGAVRGVGYELWLDVEGSTPETPSGRTRITVAHVPVAGLP